MAEADERAVWNKRYAEGSHTSLEAEALLVQVYDEYLASRPPGTALDVAGGAGRHALWLAQRGWRVKLVDISERAIALARENLRNAVSARLETLVETELADLNSIQILGQANDKYDLVLVFFFLQRELFPALAAALKPGGLLIYKTYTTEQLRLSGGPRDSRFLLQPGELQSAFPSLQLLHYRESVMNKATAELVARKP
jgi:tellurite methyltransferase